MSPKIVSSADKLNREQEMLRCARDIIVNQGEQALTIDKLVKMVPYSKGTVYNHFTSKQDIILALSNKHMEKVVDLHRRATSFNGTSRERALAVHLGFVLQAKVDPHDFMVCVTAKTVNCTENSSDERQQEHLRLEGEIVSPILNLFQSAIDAGECILPEGMNIMQMAFSCWSLNFGTHLLLSGDHEHCGVRGEMSIERELINGMNLLHDGMCWKPLSRDYDWKASIQRIKKEVFATEMQQLDAMGISLKI